MEHSKPILALIGDLMFATRVRDTLAQAGYRVEVVESQAEAFAKLRQLQPQLLVVDLACDGLSLPELVRQAEAAGVPVVAYGPHVDKEALEAALAAGCAAAVPRSRFALEMAALVDRYARQDRSAAKSAP